ncbi:MAG: CDP-diacylglycerol--glycerol-3-phosphate 3-phosphatidyltransferase [delta proteobacterium MLS_D]|jgi:cardiolipin synthase (CMP-forming)|nr:MAG: CDP-diacylglycerol--glycerol-3-phosphate 3-phosphatidyltransferase [delta proteobacterium MLS_D]
MNVPNVLTIFRILLTPVIVILLIQGRFGFALVVFAVAGVTDALDGFFARILRQKTELGSYLDPMADKALLVSSFVTLSTLNAIPAWLTVIVISRDCVILCGVAILFFMSVPFEVKPAVVSKITTVLQAAVVLAALVLLNLPEIREPYWMSVLFIAAALFTAASGLNYIITGIGYINRKSS